MVEGHVLELRVRNGQLEQIAEGLELGLFELLLLVRDVAARDGLAEGASGRRPETVGILTDNTAASISFVEPIRAEAQSRFGLRITVDETFTPPMADATPLVQRLRSRRPDMLIFPVTVISDAKLVLEKMNELGMGRGRLPTIANGIAVAQTDMRAPTRVTRFRTGSGRVRDRARWRCG